MRIAGASDAGNAGPEPDASWWGARSLGRALLRGRAAGKGPAGVHPQRVDAAQPLGGGGKRLGRSCSRRPQTAAWATRLFMYVYM